MKGKAKRMKQKEGERVAGSGWFRSPAYSTRRLDDAIAARGSLMRWAATPTAVA
jgi:hypothetical protein